MENNYFTASDYDKFTSNTLDAKMKQKSKSMNGDLNKKIKTVVTKEEIKTVTKGGLKAEQDKVVKPITEVFLLVNITLSIIELNFN